MSTEALRVSSAIADIRRATSLPEINVLLNLSPVHPAIIAAGRKRAFVLATKSKVVFTKTCECGCEGQFTTARESQRFINKACVTRYMRVQKQRLGITQ